jgi:hypothetical protein
MYMAMTMQQAERMHGACRDTDSLLSPRSWIYREVTALFYLYMLFIHTNRSDLRASMISMHRDEANPCQVIRTAAIAALEEVAHLIDLFTTMSRRPDQVACASHDSRQC